MAEGSEGREGAEGEMIKRGEGKKEQSIRKKNPSGEEGGEEGLGRASEGLAGCGGSGGGGGGGQGWEVRDTSSNACLANTICIDAAVDGVSVSRLFAYICIKLIPSPIATEIVSDAENKSTK